MKSLTRRNLLIGGAAAAAAAACVGLEMAQDHPKRAPQKNPGEQKTIAAEKFVTCFYQFNERAVQALAGALPEGPEFSHVFVQGRNEIEPRPKWVGMVHQRGHSFKYAYSLDTGKYEGWQNESDDQLKAWAIEFRGAALDSSARADYFSFNAMPHEAPANPDLRQKVARWLGYLNSAGGGPPLRGVFYFTQQNLNPATWIGSSDGFWETLDNTCDWVVGEHYEKQSFATDHTAQQIADAFDVMPRWMMASRDPRLSRIAREKFMIASSSYYGPRRSGWAGLLEQESTPDDLKRYLEKLVAAARLSEFGKRRIAFSPLDAIALDPRVYPVLAEVLKADRCGKRD